MANLSEAQRRSYERRLTLLEVSVARLSGELFTAEDIEPTAVARLHRSLEAIEVEMELLREALGEPNP